MRISRSRVETFLDCAYKYYLTYCQGWTATVLSEPLRKGGATHSFLEAWYDNQELPTEERRQIAIRAMEKALARTSPPFQIPGAAVNEQKLLQETEALAYAYMNHYGPVDEFFVFASEVKGEIPLTSKHVLCFEADQVVAYEDHLWLMETKTTQYLGPSFLKKFDLNHQLSVYTYGASRILGKLVSGVFLNIIRKPHPSARDPRPEFYRDTKIITEAHMRKALKSFINVANDIESRDKNNPDDWPQDTNRCHDYGGCPFWAHCAHAAPLEKGLLFTPRGEDYVDNPEVKGYPPPKWEE